MDEHHYLIRGGIEGRERMRVVGRVMRPTTLALLERAGVTAGMRCLDVGCGAGEVTFDLASLVGITGQVVGVDLDATKIDLARGDAEQAEVTNVEFRVADLTEGLGEAEYDVVYARFLLTHLQRPGRRRRADEGGAEARRPAGGGGHRLRGVVLPPRVRGVQAQQRDLRADGAAQRRRPVHRGQAARPAAGRRVRAGAALDRPPGRRSRATPSCWHP